MPQTEPGPGDPDLWLEDVQGERALTWVRQRNAEAQMMALEYSFLWQQLGGR